MNKICTNREKKDNISNQLSKKYGEMKVLHEFLKKEQV